MLGTSVGIRNVHDPLALPFDTVTYLLRADAARKRMDANGLFFAFDKRLNGDDADHADVRKRTERLRDLLGVLLPHFTMTTHTDLKARGLDATIERIQPRADIENEELRTYTRAQVAQVVHMREEAMRSRFTKFGWMLSRHGDGSPKGGEVNFDESLPADIQVERLYTAPAFPLNSSNGKAPYLLNEADRHTRVCIPETAEDIGREVRKINGDTTRLMCNTLFATASTILGQRDEIHASDDELVTLPLTARMKERVRDERVLADLREIVSASLHTLLP